VRLFSRSTGWLHRFSSCADILGIYSAISVLGYGRLSDRSLSVRLPNGLRFYFRGRCDQGVISHFFKNEHYVEDSPSHPITRIVDCGANIGAETAKFLIHHPEASIAAVEVERGNCDMLEQNFGKIDHVTIIQGVVWPIISPLKIALNPRGSSQDYQVIEDKSEANHVEAWPIPKIMQHMGWNEIDIVKLDIEGAEYELFSVNSEPWLHQVRCFIIEVPDCDRPGTTQAILSALSEFRFNYYVCGENLALIREELPWVLRAVVGFRDSEAVSAE
jgi:FkbM family methyltransferase